MNVAIRVDASPIIGSGHLMRCLCLAHAMHLRGAAVRFLCRDLPLHLQELITQQGHRLIALPAPETALAADGTTLAAEDAWTADRQLRDAEISASALAGAPPEWLVVDHYGLGRVWESAALQLTGAKLLSIDDMAREHDCDVLLDQNYYPPAATPYSGRVPGHCQLLLGPGYALLRPEFHVARQRAQPRDGEVRRIHIFMGGMDPNNITLLALDAVAMLGRTDLAVDVVIGQTHPAREEIEAKCRSLARTHCHVQTDRMAELLIDADLAIGAGGSATWERCALGVPTLALCLAANQADLISNGARAGFVYVPDKVDSASTLAIHLNALINNTGLRHLLSRTGMAMVTTRGAQRVVASLCSGRIGVRLATLADSSMVHEWRNHPVVRNMSRTSEPIAMEEHTHWYAAALRSPNRILLIGENGAQPIGVVRFDISLGAAEVSINLSPDHMGKGLGAALLQAAERWLLQERAEITSLQAETLAINSASRRLFEACGYVLQFTRFSKTIRP